MKKINPHHSSEVAAWHPRTVGWQKSKTYINCSLILIFILGLFLRLYHLSLNIPSLYADEVGNYNSWAVFNYAPTLYSKIYSLIFYFNWPFGLTPLSVRFPSAIYGSLLILAIYFFTRQLTSSRITPLLAALLTAVLPWSFLVSRLGHTHIPLILILVCLHLGLYLKAKTIKNYLLSLVPLLFAACLYLSIIPLFFFALSLVGLRVFLLAGKRQRLYLSFIVLLIALTVITIFITYFDGLSLKSRGLDLAIWNDHNVTADHNLYRGIAPNKFIYNYPLSIGHVFVKNYLSFFSPDWLFLKGDPVLRHSTGQVGYFFPTLIPFLIYGAYQFFASRNKKHKYLFLVWILASPLPAALTKDGGGYLLRAITIMPFLTYFCALGLSKLKPLYLFAIAPVLLFSAYSFLYGYFYVYPTLSAPSFEYGFQQLSDFQQDNNNTSMLVIWEGFYPNQYFRFWQQTPPGEYLNFTSSKISINQSIFYQSFGNLFFAWPKNVTDLNEFITTHKPDYIAFPNDYLDKNPEYKANLNPPQKIIPYPNHTPAFTIYPLNNE